MRRLIPALFLQLWLCCDEHFHRRGVVILNLDGIGIYLLVFQVVGLAILCLGTNHNSFGVLSVFQFHVGRVVQSHFLRKSLVLLFVSLGILGVFSILRVFSVLSVLSIFSILAVLGILRIFGSGAIGLCFGGA